MRKLALGIYVVVTLIAAFVLYVAYWFATGLGLQNQEPVSAPRPTGVPWQWELTPIVAFIAFSLVTLVWFFVARRLVWLPLLVLPLVLIAIVYLNGEWAGASVFAHLKELAHQCRININYSPYCRGMYGGS